MFSKAILKLLKRGISQLIMNFSSKASRFANALGTAGNNGNLVLELHCRFPHLGWVPIRLHIPPEQFGDIDDPDPSYPGQPDRKPLYIAVIQPTPDQSG